MPVNTDVRTVNVAAQEKDPGSLLAWYRELIRLRRLRTELTHGSIEFLDSHRDLLAYRREYRGATTTVILNFSERARAFPHSCIEAARSATVWPAAPEGELRRRPADAPLAPSEVRVLFGETGTTG